MAKDKNGSRGGTTASNRGGSAVAGTRIVGRLGQVRLNSQMRSGSDSEDGTLSKVRLNGLMASSDGVHEYGQMHPEYASGPRVKNFRPKTTGSVR